MITTNNKIKHAIIVFIMAILFAQLSLAQGLKITEIDLSVDYDEAYTYRMENRDRIDSASIFNNSKINADIFPGANITLTIRVENSFERENDLSEVFSRVTIEEIDDGADLEYESLNFDLEPGDDYRVDIKFSIPLDIDSGTYNIIIEAEGEDRNDTIHNTEIMAKLEIKRQSHDIRIINTGLEPSTVECERKIKISAEAMNLGSNSENLALEFKSEALGISSIDKDIFLESSDDASIDEKIYVKTLNADILKSVNAGTYPVYANLYWKNIVLFDQKIMNLKVRDCGSSTGEDENQDISNIPQNQQVPAGETSGSTENPFPFMDSNLFPIALLGAFIAVALVTVAILGYSRKNKK